MTDYTLRLRRAAYYECEGWEAHVSEDDDKVHLSYFGKPFRVHNDLGNDPKLDGWEREVLEPLLIVAQAALRAKLSK